MTTTPASRPGSDPAADAGVSAAGGDDPAGDAGLASAIKVIDVCRARWPEARFTRRGRTLQWVDGPARLDVHEGLAAAGYPRSERDAAGIRLARRFSRPVLGVIVLAAIDLAEQCAHDTLRMSRIERRDGLVERWCLHELDQLQLCPIAAGSPPPLQHLPPLRVPVDELWSRARQLVDALGSHRPVAAARPAALRPVLRRLGLLAAAAGADRLSHPSVVRRSGPGPTPEYPATSETILLDVPVPGWPDTAMIAALPADGPVRGFAPIVQLWWTDGPSPAQLEVAFAAGLPDPLARCHTYRLRRQLSDTAVAASMLCYRRLHAEPYRQRIAGYPMLAALKSAAVHQHSPQDRACRQRLESIQQQLLTLPLPTCGPLPHALDPDASWGGSRLWAAAERLLELTYRRRPQLDPKQARSASPPPRGLAVELGSTLQRLGPDALARLAPDPAAAHRRPGGS